MLPYILKQAFTSRQLREIKQLVPIIRTPAPTATLGKTIFGDIINVPRGTKTPVFDLLHEFGHWIAYKQRGNKLNSLPILSEIAANRMAARYMLATGSKPSEVKAYIRAMTPALNTYRFREENNFIKGVFDQFGKGNKINLDRNFLKELAALPNEALSTVPQHQNIIHNAAKSVANANLIDINRVVPYSQYRNSVDISGLRDSLSEIKSIDKNTFGKYLHDWRPKRLKVPKVIYL